MVDVSFVMETHNLLGGENLELVKCSPNVVLLVRKWYIICWKGQRCDLYFSEKVTTWDGWSNCFCMISKHMHMHMQSTTRANKRKLTCPLFKLKGYVPARDLRKSSAFFKLCQCHTQELNVVNLFHLSSLEPLWAPMVAWVALDLTRVKNVKFDLWLSSTTDPSQAWRSCSKLESWPATIGATRGRRRSTWAVEIPFKTEIW